MAATAWLRANKKLGMIGEYAGGVNSVCESAIADMLSYMDANDDVWKGTYWLTLSMAQSALLMGSQVPSGGRPGLGMSFPSPLSLLLFFPLLPLLSWRTR